MLLRGTFPLTFPPISFSAKFVLYFASYIVLDPGETTLEYKQVLSEKEYQENREEWGNKFRAGMGAESIKELLLDIDLEKEYAELKEGLDTYGLPTLHRVRTEHRS